MSRPLSIEAESLLKRMRRAFRANGYDGTTLSQLSQETGLATAALYHRYPEGKAQMAAAVLTDLRDWSTARVLRPLREDGDATPRERLVSMANALDELYGSGHEPCLIGLFSYGKALEQFGPSLRASLLDLIAAIATVVERAGLPADLARQRAEESVVRIQGSLILARVLGDTAPFTRVLAGLPDQLLQPSSRIG